MYLLGDINLITFNRTKGSKDKGIRKKKGMVYHAGRFK